LAGRSALPPLLLLLAMRFACRSAILALEFVVRMRARVVKTREAAEGSAGESAWDQLDLEPQSSPEPEPEPEPDAALAYTSSGAGKNLTMTSGAGEHVLLSQKPDVDRCALLSSPSLFAHTSSSLLLTFSSTGRTSGSFGRAYASSP